MHLLINYDKYLKLNYIHFHFLPLFFPPFYAAVEASWWAVLLFKWPYVTSVSTCASPWAPLR